jgi:hypothetical protein
MKKLLFILLFASTAASAQEAMVRNGQWWQKLPSQEVKWGYLVGFFDGMGLGHRLSWWPLEADEKASDCVPHVIDAYRAQMRFYLSKMDNHQLATELDGFYAEPKNKSIRLPDAVWVIANKLAGKPQAELDAMIQEYRGR